MSTIILTSCGIRNEEFKKKFFELVGSTSGKKMLYITTAIDGEDGENLAWVDREYKTILDLGFFDNDIIEYKIGEPIDISKYDFIYMMGGNTFYLLDKIREFHFDEVIKSAIKKGIVYIGSSAGSEILGKSIECALPYDKNNVGMTDYTAIGLVDGLVIPHANKKAQLIEYLKSSKQNLYLLYDGDGVIIDR